MEFSDWYNDYIFITANVEDRDDSYDDEFGTVKLKGHEVDNLHVIVYIDNTDHDLTKGFSENMIERFKGWVLQKYLGE